MNFREASNRFRHCTCRVLIGLALARHAVLALAAPPDAGEILNEQEQAQPRHLERLPRPQSQPAPLPKPGQGEAVVVVRAVRFTGGDALAGHAELQVLVADAIGREFDYAGLQALADRVTDYLKAKGYLLAYAYLPAQAIEDGILEIAIQSGRIQGKFALRSEDLRIAPHIIHDTVSGAAFRDGADAPARMESLERGLLLLNDLPGISARAVLERGSEPDTSRLVISTIEGPLLNGDAWLDNHGSRYTGVWRANVNASANDPLSIGDQASISLTHAWGIDQSAIAYRMPMGTDGMRLHVRTGTMNYRIGADVADLNLAGSAHTAHADAIYPVIRTRERNLWASLSYDYKHQRDEMDGMSLRDRRTKSMTAGLNADVRDGLGGGGVTAASLAVTTGKLDLSGDPVDQEIDRASAHSEGRYAKAVFALTRRQNLDARLALFGSIGGQIASANLDSAERFILGGPNGIRAYPLGEGSGDGGWLAKAELRYEVPVPMFALCELLAFVDTGAVSLHRFPWPNSAANAGDVNRYRLAGAGIGVNLASQDGTSLRAALAVPVGGNPGRSIAGMNSEGRRDAPRAWLQVATRF